MTSVPDHAKVVAPPPLITAAAALAGVGLRFVWPLSFFPRGHAWIPAMVCFAAATILAAALTARAPSPGPVRWPMRRQE